MGAIHEHVAIGTALVAWLVVGSACVSPPIPADDDDTADDDDVVDDDDSGGDDDDSGGDDDDDSSGDDDDSGGDDDDSTPVAPSPMDFLDAVVPAIPVCDGTSPFQVVAGDGTVLPLLSRFLAPIGLCWEKSAPSSCWYMEDFDLVVLLSFALGPGPLPSAFTADDLLHFGLPVSPGLWTVPRGLSASPTLLLGEGWSPAAAAPTGMTSSVEVDITSLSGDPWSWGGSVELSGRMLLERVNSDGSLVNLGLAFCTTTWVEVF